jgi:hypothetical protein
VRGARDAEGNAPHLLSFRTHASQETLFEVRGSRENQGDSRGQSRPAHPPHRRTGHDR